MTNLIPSPSVSLVSGRPTVTSMQVAEYFGKKHNHVLRDIRRIIDECEGVSNFGQTPLFEETTYADGQNGQAYPMFIIYRDGFMLLAMGYTGKKALQIKLVFISAFNAMEAELSGRAERPTLDTASRLSRRPDPERKTLASIKSVWVSMAPFGYRDASAMVNAHFGVEGVDDMTVAQCREAAAWIQEKIDLLQKPQPLALPPAEPTPTHRMAVEGVARLRKIAFDYSTTSDSLFGLFIKDDVVQSLHLATVLSMQALASHYAGMAARS